MKLLDFLNSKLDGLTESSVAEIDAGLQEISDHIDEFLDQVKQGLVNDPEPIFALLRRFKPTLIVKNYALVTRFEDVQEIFSHDSVFQQVYAEKMRQMNRGLNYILGMENSPDYTANKSIIWQAMPRQDIPGRLIPLFSATSGDIVARANGELDVGIDLFRGVQLSLIQSYFGLVVPDEDAFFAAQLDLSRYIFGDFGNDPANQTKALAACQIYNQVLQDSITLAKQSPDATTVLGRLIKMQQNGVDGTDDESIRSNLFGTIMGAVAAPSVTFTRALDFLIDRAVDLQGLQQAALANEDEHILRYIYEAYRFQPMTPAWFRHTAEDYTVAKGTARATMIPAGTMVLALTQSAMMDGNILDSPDTLKLDRPIYHYMVYGYGIHECMGKYISDPMLALALKPLAQQKNLRRVPGAAGQVQLQSGFPNGFRVCFDTAGGAEAG